MNNVTKPTLNSEATMPLVVRPVTINQLVAYNMAWYRKAAGLTQDELGKRLGGWTKVAVSAAERSWDGRRVRKFDADELLAIARAIGVPVAALFLPPEDAGTAIAYELEEIPRGQRVQLTELFPYLLAAPDEETPVIAAFRRRLMALGTLSFLSELDRARNILGEAKMRAESLELDAQERHRRAVGSLVQQRDELERQVDYLRTFEREYRSRLLGYMEGQIASLRSDEGDKRRFVLKKGSSGKYHFNLLAANGQVVATSETYENKRAALNGIESVKNSASYAGIEDETSE